MMLSSQFLYQGPSYSNYDLFSSELIFAGYGSEEIVAEETKKINFNVIMSMLMSNQYFNFIKERTKKVNNMKKIEVYLTMSECNRYPYDDGLYDESILFSSTLGLCYGDSGGPLMKISPNSTNHLVIGIARGARVCSSGIANIYTGISQYVPWIQKNLEKFDEINAHNLYLKFFGWMILMGALTAFAWIVFCRFNSNDIRIHDADVIGRELRENTDAHSLLLKNLADKIEKIDEKTGDYFENHRWMFLIIKNIHLLGLTALAWTFVIILKEEVNLVNINIV